MERPEPLDRLPVRRKTNLEKAYPQTSAARCIKLAHQAVLAAEEVWRGEIASQLDLGLNRSRLATKGTLNAQVRFPCARLENRSWTGAPASPKGTWAENDFFECFHSRRNRTLAPETKAFRRFSPAVP